VYRFADTIPRWKHPLIEEDVADGSLADHVRGAPAARTRPVLAGAINDLVAAAGDQYAAAAGTRGVLGAGFVDVPEVDVVEPGLTADLKRPAQVAIGVGGLSANSR